MREATKGVLSMKNEYYIPKYRYYELKYRCLQYNDWLEEFNNATGYLATHDTSEERVDGGEIRDLVYEAMVKRSYYKCKMDTLKHCLLSLPMYLQNPIFEAVTEGKGWQVIQARHELTCTRDEYYKAYHYFFYIYSKCSDTSSLPY